MLKEIIQGVMPELTTIEAKTQLTLRKTGILTLYSNNVLKKNEKCLWMPALGLISAKTAKDVNFKALQLAAILHLFNYATELHFLLPEESDTGNINNEVQYPILVGDMLYSQVCADLCRYDLHQYLDYITSLIALVHKELAERDLKQKQNLIAVEHELECNALISEGACYLGSHVIVGNSYVNGIIRSLGYNLGFIKAARDMKLTKFTYKDYWDRVHLLTDMLPPGTGKNFISNILQSMDSGWELDCPEIREVKKA